MPVHFVPHLGGSRLASLPAFYLGKPAETVAAQTTNLGLSPFFPVSDSPLLHIFEVGQFLARVIMSSGLHCVVRQLVHKTFISYYRREGYNGVAKGHIMESARLTPHGEGCEPWKR